MMVIKILYTIVTLFHFIWPLKNTTEAETAFVSKDGTYEKTNEKQVFCVWLKSNQLS